MRRQAGDTLIEVTFALGILAIVLISSTLLANRAFNLGGAAREQTVAANLIQQQVEALRNYSDANPSTTTLANYDTTDPEVSGWLDSSAALGWIQYNNTNHTFHMGAGGGNAWSPYTGEQTSGIYTIFITPTNVLGHIKAGSGGPDEVKFVIIAEWQSNGGTSASSCPADTNYSGNCLAISTYLTDNNGLITCDDSAGSCSPVGWTPPPPPPPITVSLSVKGTITGDSNALEYTDQGDSITLSYSSTNATSCTLTVGNGGQNPRYTTSQYGTSVSNQVLYDNDNYWGAHPSNGDTYSLIYSVSCSAPSTSTVTSPTQTITAYWCSPRILSGNDAGYGNYETFSQQSRKYSSHTCPGWPG